jgi:hypothetical protein
MDWRTTATGVMLSCVVGCSGTIREPRPNPFDTDAGPGGVAEKPVGGGPGTTLPPTVPGNTLPGMGSPGVTPAGSTTSPGTTQPGTTPPPVGTPPGSTPVTDPSTPINGQTVGVGDLAKPALGPLPTEIAKVGGAPFVLVKNWDFGANGTIRNIADLTAEFNYHDQFGTIANGTNYGAVTVAPTAATAVAANDLGLKNNKQPVEDPARPYRELTAESIKTYVRPLSETATTVSASAHDVGNGSFFAKWRLPSGGSQLKRDILWETRGRIPTPLPAFWFSYWTAGTKWNQGAEMDVVESFGTPNIGTGAKAFHVNSVGGLDSIEYDSWPATLAGIGVPTSARDLSQWHTFTWVYLTDDTFKVYYDGYVVQHGTLTWTLGGKKGGESLDMNFLFDLSWGHTQIKDVNISLPAAQFPMVYEVDYSRVYLR